MKGVMEVKELSMRFPEIGTRRAFIRNGIVVPRVVHYSDDRC